MSEGYKILAPVRLSNDYASLTAVKPPRLCQWQQCPHNLQDSCDHVGLKICKRCRAVRYCSKACQYADWPIHKSACRAPNSDLDDWLEKYAWLFKWAALQAMLSKPDEHFASTHCLLFDVRRNPDSNTQTPSIPFIISAIHVDDHHANTMLPPLRVSYSSADREKSSTIRRGGGVGRVLLNVRVLDIPFVMVERHYDLYEPRDTPRFSYWKGIVKGVANGRMVLSDGLGGANYDPSRPSSDPRIEEIQEENVAVEEDE
ncbi:hypothetical protein EWM64_g2454 [Hericium alpestre]|uniref:MYND-type domain-containing protein n=1 Tax=Hericium alpestre TaxID=135208 RepID=A0A4Z0A542_9AGAM|nr:hypothetical protein EWM64_g2454 [Hericium alpestre]